MNTSAVNLPSPKVPSFSQTFTNALPPVPRFASPPLAPVFPSVVVPLRTPLEIEMPKVVPPKTIQNWLRNNMGKVVAICLVLLITIILIARLVLMQRKNKKQREEEMKAVETDPEWESFFNGSNNNPQALQEPPPQQPVYQPQHSTLRDRADGPMYDQQKQQQAFYEQTRLPPHSQHPLHLQQPQPGHLQPPQHPLHSQPPQQPGYSQLPLQQGGHSQPPQTVPVQAQPHHLQQTQQQTNAKLMIDDAAKMREDSSRAGGRGIQNRFSPAENMHGGAGMPHSMMPESTRPIRETSSDGTFKVKPEDLLISTPTETETSSVASDKAPESSS